MLAGAEGRAVGQPDDDLARGGRIGGARRPDDHVGGEADGPIERRFDDRVAVLLPVGQLAVGHQPGDGGPGPSPAPAERRRQQAGQGPGRHAVDPLLKDAEGRRFKV